MTTASVAFGALETRESLSPAEIDAKARALLAELTLAEKVRLLDGDLRFWRGIDLMSAPRGYSSQAWVAGAVPRLGIPGIRFSDGPRGIVMEGGTTFPVTMARGATFDPELEERVGDIIGHELRALGGNHFGGVCINLLRHPAWGRAQETYGEDSHHLGEMGAALVRGVQRHVMACAKHFALNSMENARSKVDVSADARTLHEVYLPHFKRTVDAGVASVMSAYNSVNGAWCGESHALLTGILKEEWGFAGFVLTDFIFGMRDAKAAMLAGQDLEMPFGMHFDKDLNDLVERGEVSTERIDDALLRILHEQVRFGQGRDPADYPRDGAGSAANRAVSREVAEKSIVLLKNDGILPLAAPPKRIAVIGALAATPNTGDGGSSNTRPAHVVTPLEGLKAALGDGTAIAYHDGTDPHGAANAARMADVAIVVVGYTHADEGEFIPPDQLTPFADIFPEPTPEEEPIARRVLGGMSGFEGGFSVGGDRLSLTLHPRDEALIAAVTAANPRTIVAVMAGSAVIMEAWKDKAAAILMLWYPGEQGGHAFADIVLGRINPSGRLPCTFPARGGDLPFFDRDATAITYDLWHGYRKLARDGARAAFPFGFGLGYSGFALSNLRLAKENLSPAEALTLTVDVTNGGRVDGEDVVQLYVSAIGSAVERAPRELKAFRRIRVPAGETRTATLSVPVADLAYYRDGSGFVVEPIAYEARVAHHAEDDGLTARFRVS